MRDDDNADDSKADIKNVVFAGEEGRAFRLLLEEFDRVTASAGTAGQKPKAIFSRFAKAWRHGTAAGAWLREEVPGYGEGHHMYDRAKAAVSIKMEARALGYIAKAMSRFSRAASYLGTSADLSEDIPTFEEFCVSGGTLQGSFVTAGSTMPATTGNSDAGSDGTRRHFDHKMYVAYVEHSEKVIFHNAYVYFREAAVAKFGVDITADLRYFHDLKHKAGDSVTQFAQMYFEAAKDAGKATDVVALHGGFLSRIQPAELRQEVHAAVNAQLDIAKTTWSELVSVADRASRNFKLHKANSTSAKTSSVVDVDSLSKAARRKLLAILQEKEKVGPAAVAAPAENAVPRSKVYVPPTAERYDRGAAAAATARAKGVVLANGQSPGLKLDGSPVAYCPDCNRNGHHQGNCWKRNQKEAAPLMKQSAPKPKSVVFAAAEPDVDDEVDEQADILRQAVLGAGCAAVAVPVVQELPTSFLDEDVSWLASQSMSRKPTPAPPKMLKPRALPGPLDKISKLLVQLEAAIAEAGLVTKAKEGDAALACVMTHPLELMTSQDKHRYHAAYVSQRPHLFELAADDVGVQFNGSHVPVPQCRLDSCASQELVDISWVRDTLGEEALDWDRAVMLTTANGLTAAPLLKGDVHIRIGQGTDVFDYVPERVCAIDIGSVATILLGTPFHYHAGAYVDPVGSVLAYRPQWTTRGDATLKYLTVTTLVKDGPP